EAKKHPPVKLVVGMISGRKPLFDAAQRELTARFGPLDYESILMPWEFTDYYSRELGENLGRKFLSFERLIDPARLAEIKSFTNQLEGKFSEGGARRINLDPGYLDSAKLVLATTKNRDHRIYIGQGIFAEVTLHFRGKSFRAWEWTYPDYATPEYIAIFNEIRALYWEQLKGTT
ncbi:MAG: DUF4416 family protein, partial [Anaerolineae bacterium]